MPAKSKIISAIIIILDGHNGEVQGTESLALELGALNSKKDVLMFARRLQDQGAITICRSRGGRGQKTIYKRNRNQPGLARKAA